MNCTEFQNGLAEFLEGGAAAEAQAHRKSCAACAGLAADLEEISAQARLLEAEEPGEHLRARILAAAEAEGLTRVEVPAPRLVWWGAEQGRWAVPAWAAAVAALLLLAFGIRILQQSQPAAPPATAVVHPAPLVDNDDLQFLQAMAKKHPTRSERYRKHLEAVNASIRDAKRSVQEDPGNELARERLIQAYDQKSALYEMAMAGSMR